MEKPQRLDLIYAELENGTPGDCRDATHRLFETAFDLIEDAHSGVPKDPMAHLSKDTRGRMYPPHPMYGQPGPNSTTIYRHFGHRTIIGVNGSFRIVKVEADLSETVVLEKRGADGKGYWED